MLRFQHRKWRISSKSKMPTAELGFDSFTTSSCFAVHDAGTWYTSHNYIQTREYEQLDNSNESKREPNQPKEWRVRRNERELVRVREAGRRSICFEYVWARRREGSAYQRHICYETVTPTKKATTIQYRRNYRRWSARCAHATLFSRCPTTERV